MYVVGQIPKSAWGHEYILLSIDFPTNVVPIWKAISRNIAKEFMLLFSCMGIPKDIPKALKEWL